MITDSQRTDAYRFFAIAFGAAPGAEYYGQLVQAYEFGLTTKEVVNIFTTKDQFTSVYSTTLTNAEFANKIVDNVVGASATQAAKALAKADVKAGRDRASGGRHASGSHRARRARGRHGTR